MPERPDLEHQVPRLAAEVVGRHVVGVRLRKPALWRSDLPPAALEGRAIRAVRRRGHFVCFDLDGDRDLAVHPMLAGRFSLAPGKDPADLALALALDDGRELRLRDDQQMAKVYLFPKGGEAAVPGLCDIGVDVLSDAFTVERLRALLKGRREQAKVFLLDKAALDSFGNAYADEALFEAGIHPKTPVNKLTPEQVATLHAAMRKVLGDARDEIARRDPPLEEKLRDFLKVRNRAGEPCPRCGGRIRAAGVHGHDAFYCPTCQPDGTGRGIVELMMVS